MVPNHAGNAENSLILASSENDRALRARLEAGRKAEEARLRAQAGADLHEVTQLEIRTAYRNAVVAAAAKKVNRVPLGDTIFEEVAGLYRVLAQIAEKAGLRQRDGQLLVVKNGKVRPVKTVEQLRSVVVLACADRGNFEVPWLRYSKDKDGAPLAIDAEPRLAAWRTVMATHEFPGIPIWSGRDSGDTAQQRALALLVEAIEARRAMEASRVRWEVAATELAELIGWDRSAIERLVELAGYRVSRPVTAAGKPKKDPISRRALIRIEG